MVRNGEQEQHKSRAAKVIHHLRWCSGCLLLLLLLLMLWRGMGTWGVCFRIARPLPADEVTLPCPCPCPGPHPWRRLPVHLHNTALTWTWLIARCSAPKAMAKTMPDGGAERPFVAISANAALWRRACVGCDPGASWELSRRARGRQAQHHTGYTEPLRTRSKSVCDTGSRYLLHRSRREF